MSKSFTPSGLGGGGPNEDLSSKLQSLLRIPPTVPVKVNPEKSPQLPPPKAVSARAVDNDKPIGEFMNECSTDRPLMQPKESEKTEMTVGEVRYLRSRKYKGPNEPNRFGQLQPSTSQPNTSTTNSAPSLRRPEPPFRVSKKPEMTTSTPSGARTTAQVFVHRDSKDYTRREPVRQKPRSGTPLRQLLDRPDCPMDLKNSRHLLIDSTLDDHKPTNYLHLNEFVVKLFNGHYIEPLKKKSSKFPRANYFCNLCNYHMDTTYNVVGHILNARHVLNYQSIEMLQVLEWIGMPSPSHQKALTKYILSVVTAHGISNNEISERQAIVDRLNEVVNRIGFGCSLSIFGSSASGFGFSNSDVDINLSLDPKSEPAPTFEGVEEAAAFTQVHRALKMVPFCKDVTESFSARAVSIRFVDASTGKQCIIHFNNSSGVMLAQLLIEYDKCDPRVRPLATMLRFVAKLAEIDSQLEGTLPPHCYNVLTIHFLQFCGVLPILHKLVPFGETRLFATAEEARLVWKTDNNDNIGRLWMGLLRYYAVEFPTKNEVVSISQENLLRKSDSVWNRKLSIQDPIIARSNLSRSLCLNRICDYITDRIKLTYRYFGIPRTAAGPLYDGIILSQYADPTLIYYDHETQPQGQVGSANKARLIVAEDNHGCKKKFVIRDDVDLLHDKLDESEYFYKLDQGIVQAGVKPPRICRSCGLEGHLKRDCPEEAVPQVKPVRPPSRFTLQVLSEVMLRNYELEALNDHDVKVRQQITSEILRVLVPAFPDLDLTMFGSTYNGFGLHLSDVDICFQLRDNPINRTTITQTEVNTILATIVERLRNYGGMQNILPIPSAKVPIVKFLHRGSHLEGDISLSNILALHNTRMLRTYCKLDNRLQVLGCFLKRVTKLCDISDASKGSLSSYGFVLMLIHFLQQHNPPVLPVLQELSPKGTRMVEGSNVWFFDNIENLQNVWPDMGRNKESVAELWLAFLQYYTEVFDFENNIIQIAQKQCVTRFSKLWLTDTAITVEDPFDKAHNLGAGLSRRMGVYIIKSFQRYREAFNMSVDNVKTNDWMDVFLNPRRLRGNTSPPVDRQCRICNRIGHFAKSCTFSKANDRVLSQLVDNDEFGDELRLDELDIEQDSREIEHDHLEQPQNVIVQQRQPLEDAAINKPLNNYSNQPLVGSQQVENKENSEQQPELNQKVSPILYPTSINSNIGELGANLEKEFKKQAYGIQFFGKEKYRNENEVINQMISRNPGVVFQLPVTQASPPFNNGSSEIIVPANGNTNTMRPTSSGFAPPPGFVVTSHPPTAVPAVVRQAPVFFTPTSYQMNPQQQPMMFHCVTNSAGVPPPGFQSLVTQSQSSRPILQHSFENENRNRQYFSPANAVGNYHPFQPEESQEATQQNHIYEMARPQIHEMMQAQSHEMMRLQSHEMMRSQNHEMMRHQSHEMMAPRPQINEIVRSQNHLFMQQQLPEMNQLDHRTQKLAQVNISANDVDYALPNNASTMDPETSQYQQQFGEIHNHSPFQGNETMDTPQINRATMEERYAMNRNHYDMVNKSPMMVMNHGQVMNHPNDSTPPTNSYLLSHIHHGPVVSAIQAPQCLPHQQYQQVQYQHQPLGNTNYDPHNYAFQQYQHQQLQQMGRNNYYNFMRNNFYLNNVEQDNSDPEVDQRQPADRQTP